MCFKWKIRKLPSDLTILFIGDKAGLHLSSAAGNRDCSQILDKTFPGFSSLTSAHLSVNTELQLAFISIFPCHLQLMDNSMILLPEFRKRFWNTTLKKYSLQIIFMENRDRSTISFILFIRYYIPQNKSNNLKNVGESEGLERLKLALCYTLIKGIPIPHWLLSAQDNSELRDICLCSIKRLKYINILKHINKLLWTTTSTWQTLLLFFQDTSPHQRHFLNNCDWGAK